MAQFGWSSGLVLHSLCQLATWAFVAVLITVLPGVGGENSPRGNVSSGTFHQEANNCLSAQLEGIPPDSEGRGCGRVPRGSAHAPCRAGRTWPRLAPRFPPAPGRSGALETRLCGRAAASSSATTPLPRRQGARAFFLYFSLSSGAPGESVLLSSRGRHEDGNRWRLRRNRGQARDSAAGWKVQGLPDTLSWLQTRWPSSHM